MQLQYSIDGGGTWTRLGDDLGFYTTGPNQPCALASQVFTDQMVGQTIFFHAYHYVQNQLISAFLSEIPMSHFRFVASVSGNI